MRAVSNSAKGMRASEGFTLIEVLVAIVLLSIGILGVAQLQFESFQNSRNALYRNQASVIAEDLLDRVRGNPQGLIDGAYNGLDFDSSDTTVAQNTGGTCAAGCNAAAIAVQDVYEWAGNFIPTLTNYRQSLPSAAGTGGVDAADTTRQCPGRRKYDVSVSWRQPDGTTGSVDMSTCL